MSDELPPLPRTTTMLSDLQSGTMEVVHIDDVREYGKACAAAERERIKVLERLVIDAAYSLKKARIWNGMGWTYNPLHPVHYAPMRERLDNECNNIEAIRKGE